ncbi:MAG: hypothetical protein ACE5H0_01780 [Bacteroidota bacterium]
MENDFQRELGKKILESLFFLVTLGAGLYLLLRFLRRAPFSFRIFHFDYDLPTVINLIAGIVLCSVSVWILIEVVLKGKPVP